MLKAQTMAKISHDVIIRGKIQYDDIRVINLHTPTIQHLAT